MAWVCPEVTALKNYEEEVVVSLLNASLDCLSRESMEIGVIPQNARDDVKSMDWDHVPHPRVIRYLLMHVYRAIEDNPRLYKQWLHVLSKLITSVEVLDKVRQSYTLVTSPHEVSAQMMHLAEGIGQELVAGAKRPRPRAHNVFTEQHISTLTNILTACASKSEELRIILGLPDHIGKDLHVILIAHSSIACFGRLLREWIVGGHKNAKDPTLENLEEALRSEAVGLGSEANQLQNNLRQSGMIFVKDEEPAPQKKPCLENWSLEIARQSCDTVVTEGKSTLLEVQAVTSGDISISYQWLKDGCCLGEQCGQEILCINKSDLSSKGTYTCQVTDGTTVSSSRPILLTVNISPVKKVLIDRYSNQPEVPEDSWPPAGANTYINLALIKPGNIERAGTYARNTIQGNIDDIMADKEKIEYDTVFTDFSHTTRLLIEGRPGSGKTTLVHRFSKDWASGNNPKLNLKNIKLLFLVHLRGFFNDPCITLRDIIKLYYTGESMADGITCEAEENGGEGLCFILDGLDEYQPKSKNNTFIFKLIRGLHLPNAIVIIASRPAASVQFRKMADKKIEIIGFLKAQVNEYVEKYPFIETDKWKDLQKYLEQHPNVHHMCYLPIHAAMVCYLFDIMGGALPRTETEMYTDFTNSTLLRAIRREEDSEMVHIESPEDLTDHGREMFLRICRLGFEKTVSSKQVMRKAEVSEFFRDVHCGKESMGLITVDCMARKCGFENLYTFLHLTFQEYLAAYHVYKSSDAEQLKLLRKYGSKKHMQVVWKFYCGLTSFEEKDIQFHEIMKSAYKDDLFGVQCAFESQQSTTCDHVVQFGESGALSFQGHFLTPSDLTAIGYVLKNSTCPVEKLVLDRCKFGMEGLNAFLDEAGDRILSVKTLCFHGKACVMEQYELLNSCLHRMSSLEEFDVTNTSFGSMKLSKLTAKKLTLPNLQTLKVSTPEHITKRLFFNSTKVDQIVFCDCSLNNISTISIKEHLLKVFGGPGAAFYNSVSRLVEVDLKNSKLQESEVTLVSEGLKQQACCTSLNLSNCNIGDGGCENLVNGLLHCSALRELFLRQNRINNRGARALAGLFDTQSRDGSTSVTKNGGPYLEVDMSYNQIGDNGALSLAESLKNSASVRRLDLKCNKIGDKGAMAITRAIMDKDCQLQIWNHRITEKGSRAIVDLKPDADGNFHVLNINSGMSVEAEILLFNMQDDGEESIVKNVILDIDKCSEGLSKTVAAIVKCCFKIETLEIICTINFMVTETETLRKCTKLHVRGGGANWVMTLAVSLKHCNSLKTLILEKNGIGAEDIIALAENLRHCNNLQTLNLDGNNIGACGAKALAGGLQNCSNLQTLNLEGNTIGADGAKVFAEGLQHCNNLRTLNLGKNDIDADGVKVLLQHCSYLHTLSLQWNCIGNDCAKVFPEGLQHCNSLHALNLKGNKIGNGGTKALAEGLRHCNSLQTLNLEENEIGNDGAKALAEGLQRCNSIQILDLRWNDIDDDGAKALAEGLQNCNNLQTLKLCGNFIRADVAKVLAKSLQHCNILEALNCEGNNVGDDGAKALAEGMQHCKYLQELELIGNDFGNDGAKALAEGMQHCKDLQTLNLVGNHIGDDGAKALAEGMQHYRYLDTLNLCGNSIGDDGAKALAEGLQHCIGILILNLFENDLGADGAKALAEGLQHCNDLEMLHLEGNEIGNSGAKALAEGMQHCKHLRTLSLSGYSIRNDGAKALAEGMQHCKDLDTLELGGNSIGDDGAKALAEGLQHCNDLQTLNLLGNSIGDNGAKALAEGMQQCNNLRALDLGGNNIDDEGAKALAEGMKQCNNLQILILGDNNIDNEGAKALAEGMHHCKDLQTLNLVGNHIGDDGAKALAEGMQHYRYLDTLNLCGNSIGDDGAKALAEGLQHCIGILILNLFENDLGADGAKALAEGLQHCNDLEMLNLEGNEIGNSGAKALAEGMQHCKHLRTLSLSGYSIRNDGAKALAEGMQHCKDLDTLELGGNSIGDNGAKALAEGMQQCNNLRALDLGGNNIDDEGAKALAEGMKQCNNLQILILGDNNIDNEGAKALAEGMHHCNHLQTLDFSGNSIGNDGAEALAEGMRHCNDLQTLRLEGSIHTIDDVSAKAFAEGMLHCSNLQTLELFIISNDSAKALAVGMQHCCNLQTLNLGGIYTDNGGFEALAQGMQHCSNLQTLNFENNKVGNDGIKALAEGMQHCNYLQTLNLEGNSIGDDGAEALAQGMQHCNNLQTLNLKGNNIGNDGAKALAEGLQHCNNLHTLNLEGNNIGDNAVKALVDVMLHYSDLQMVNLEGNDIGNDCAKAQAALYAVACKH